MRTHSLNNNIALPDHLGDLHTAKRTDGTLCLSDDFRTYGGLIYQSEELNSISASFDYEAHGYGALLPGPGIFERAPIADYINGELGPIKQAVFDYSQKDKDLPIEDLESDLLRYEPGWRDIFNRFGAEVAPMMGNRFEIRLKCLRFRKEKLHTDKEIIGVLPLGVDRLSTICKGKGGEMIRPHNGSFVTSTPMLEHAGPVSEIPRAGLGVTKYAHQIR